MGFPASVADGGDNSVDNCIPLCFNCHAEVKSYNPKHPKGRMRCKSMLWIVQFVGWKIKGLMIYLKSEFTHIFWIREWVRKYAAQELERLLPENGLIQI